jgi:putative ABC transport system ATP-binding protein
MATEVAGMTQPWNIPSDSGVICTENLWKTYDADSGQQVHALRGVDLTIHHNEYVAIMGPSGSGKSTLMTLIGCLDTPTKGRYWLNGHLVTELNEDELARIRNKEIGFVFQNFNLLARATALHNVGLPLIYAGVPAGRRIERARKALTQVGMGDRTHHKPSELSGGQRQRVAIARALINSPAILLADEPTGNLDSRTGNEIMALFDDLHQRGNTIVLVTHERDIAEYAHRVIYLNDGVIASDTPTSRGRGSWDQVAIEEPVGLDSVQVV